METSDQRGYYTTKSFNHSIFLSLNLRDRQLTTENRQQKNTPPAPLERGVWRSILRTAVSEELEVGSGDFLVTNTRIVFRGEIRDGS